MRQFQNFSARSASGPYQSNRLHDSWMYLHGLWKMRRSLELNDEMWYHTTTLKHMIPLCKVKRK